MQEEELSNLSSPQKMVEKLQALQLTMMYGAFAVLIVLAIMVAGAVYLSAIERIPGSPKIGPMLLAYSITLLMLVLLTLCAALLLHFKYIQGAMPLVRALLSSEPGPMPFDSNSMWYPWAAALNAGRLKTAQYIAALEGQTDFKEAILRSAIDGIITSNEEGVVTDFNPAAEKMFGWSRDEILGQKMETTILPPAFRDRHRHGMARYISEGQANVIGRKVEMQGLRKDGTIFPMELAIAEAQVSDTRIFIGYIRDLSDEHATQSELQVARESLHQSEKLNALGSLLAGVAHELNNPLAIVVGRAAILEEKLVGSPHLAPIQKLRAAADRCSRIVKTFLAMARQSGPRRSIVKLNELIESALDITVYGLRADGIEIVQELDKSLPTTAADEDQLIQVLINLIVNAQQAMATKSGSHRLTLRTRHDPILKVVVIEVEDTGPGIEEEIIARVFDPFFTTKDVGVGTGMGLSVSRGMIEAQNGTLSLIRTNEKGTLFLVSLPILQDDVLVDLAIAPEKIDVASGRILIVDDEVELAALLVECLTPMGVICDVVSDGGAALRKIEATHYDAVFTDVRMPGMDGVSLYERLQALYPKLASKLAFVSGDVLHNDAARIAAIGDRPVIEKPFDPQQVRDIAVHLLAVGATS